MLRSAVRNLSRPGKERPLEEHIDWYAKQGYRVVSQTEHSAQLVKPKQFSFIWALLWFLCLGVGLIVYLLYYASKKDKMVYLTESAGFVAAS